LIKIIQNLDDKETVLKILQNDGLKSSFGEYVKYSFEEIQDINSTIMCYSGDDMASVDSFLNQLNGAESDYLRLINQANNNKSELKAIQLKIRNANKRTRLHVLAIQERLKADIQDQQTVMSKLKTIFIG